MPRHEISVSPPRAADLDTQRHVTSRTYESYCWEARYALLAEQGYGSDRLIEEKILLRPASTSLRFFREQMPGAALQVRTELIPGEDADLAFVQEVVEAGSGATACRIVTHVRSEVDGKALRLQLKPTSPGEDDAWTAEPLTAPPQKFAGRNKRVSAPAVMLYSERTPFFDHPPTALWRIAEEGRWQFSYTVGLDQKKIYETDTITFFTSANFEFYRIPRGGEEMIIRTWIESIEKIRCFMRQDVETKDGELLFSVREEQLIVSLSRRRPRKAPPEFVGMIADYMESAPV